jgi:hypothetical protein
MITLAELDAKIAVLQVEEDRLWKELKQVEEEVKPRIDSYNAAWMKARKELQHEQQRREVLAEMQEL